MGWDEIRTRLGQAGGKRWDLIRYRIGFGRTAVDLPASTRASHFFFDSEDLPRRIELIRSQLPGEVEKIVTEADAICRHHFDLLGYEKLYYGTEIDWHLDAVHNKRAPLKPWFKIDFLDFQRVGDHKITWEINRHQHLVTLAKAWCFTRERRFADELSGHWSSWQKANPYPLGINWASTLEVAFRTLSWLWVQKLMAPCEFLPAWFAGDLLQGLRWHGRYIERYLSTYFSPNTHLLGEAVALFFLGTLCPQIPESRRWQRSGWEVVLNEAQRQVRPDGVYFEQALYYHVYALDFFLYARILAKLNGLEIPPAFDEILKRMLHVVDAVSQTGVAEGFGDDDGGRLFNPRRNHVEHMTDPLAIGAACYGESYAAANLTEESIWLFGDKAVTERSGGVRRRESQAFEAGGIYLMADQEQQLMIDGGPQGIGRSGHGHADALSIRFTVGEQRVLVDAGACVYISDNGDRNRFRGTAAHNTVQVDGLDQAVLEGPFAWSSIPKVKVDRWMAGETFDLFVGEHDGYCRLKDPVVHQRTVFHARPGFWIVRDVLKGQQAHALQSFWHFAPEAIVNSLPGTLIGVVPHRPDPLSLILLSSSATEWTTTHTSEKISPAYGAKQEAYVGSFSATIPLPAEHAVALTLPQRNSQAGKFDEIRESESYGVRGYRLEQEMRTHYLFFGENETWGCGPWTSDARVLYCKVEDGRLGHLVMVSGSFAKWHDKDLAVHRGRVERFEWLSSNGGAETFTSDSASAGQMIASNFEFLNPVH